MTAARRNPLFAFEQAQNFLIREYFIANFCN